jgi:hypothetical protein
VSLSEWYNVYLSWYVEGIPKVIIGRTKQLDAAQHLNDITLWLLGARVAGNRSAQMQCS